MPRAFVLELQGSPKRLRWPDHYAHGLFYHLLAAVSPALGTAVHAAPRVPFTLSARQRQGQLLLRVSLLDDALFAPLLSELLNLSAAGLPLGDQAYWVARVLATPEGHPRAGAVTWGQIMAAPPRQTLSLEFLTPTVFATSRPDGVRHYTPLPEPRLVLGSLLRSFQAFCPQPYTSAQQATFQEVFDHQVTLTRFDLHSQRHQASKMALTGFVGRSELHYPADHPEVRLVLARLARLAPYAGVGTKTPYGMGQVALLEE